MSCNKYLECEVSVLESCVANVRQGGELDPSRRLQFVTSIDQLLQLRLGLSNFLFESLRGLETHCSVRCANATQTQSGTCIRICACLYV